MYKQARKEAGLSIEEAAFRCHIGSRTLVNYESGITNTPPEVALQMAEVYGEPALTARYCAEYCPIGQVHAQTVEQRDLAGAVLGIIKECNDVRTVRDRLIEIAEDGIISEDEVPDFERAMDELVGLEKRILTLKLWAARYISRGEVKKKKTA